MINTHLYHLEESIKTEDSQDIMKITVHLKQLQVSLKKATYLVMHINGTWQYLQIPTAYKKVTKVMVPKVGNMQPTSLSSLTYKKA
jgi:membrane-bound lytic murein transglycosylase MltF